MKFNFRITHQTQQSTVLHEETTHQRDGLKIIFCLKTDDSREFRTSEISLQSIYNHRSLRMQHVVNKC